MTAAEAKANEEGIAYLRLLAREPDVPDADKIAAIADAVVAVDVVGRATGVAAAATASHVQEMHGDVRAMRGEVRELGGAVADLQAAIIVRDERTAKSVAARTAAQVTKSNAKVMAPLTIFMVVVTLLKLLFGG